LLVHRVTGQAVLGLGQRLGRERGRSGEETSSDRSSNESHHIPYLLVLVVTGTYYTTACARVGRARTRCCTFAAHAVTVCDALTGALPSPRPSAARRDWHGRG